MLEYNRANELRCAVKGTKRPLFNHSSPSNFLKTYCNYICHTLLDIAITVSYTAASNPLTNTILMIHSRIFSLSLFCLFVAACNTQEQAAAVKQTADIKTTPEKIAPVKKTIEIKTVPEKKAPEIIAKQKTTTIKTRPAINLSIDNMHVDHHIDNDNFLNTGTEPNENNNSLFKTLSKNKIEPKINLSGKLFTDEDKLENKEYLKSVDGVQINIEGSFN